MTAVSVAARLHSRFPALFSGSGAAASDSPHSADAPSHTAAATASVCVASDLSGEARLKASPLWALLAPNVGLQTLPQEALHSEAAYWEAQSAAVIAALYEWAHPRGTRSGDAAGSASVPVPRVTVRPLVTFCTRPEELEQAVITADSKRDRLFVRLGEPTHACREVDADWEPTSAHLYNQSLLWQYSLDALLCALDGHDAAADALHIVLFQCYPGSRDASYYHLQDPHVRHLLDTSAAFVLRAGHALPELPPAVKALTARFKAMNGQWQSTYHMEAPSAALLQQSRERMAAGEGPRCTDAILRVGGAVRAAPASPDGCSSSAPAPMCHPMRLRENTPAVKLRWQCRTCYRGSPNTHMWLWECAEQHVSNSIATQLPAAPPRPPPIPAPPPELYEDQDSAEVIWHADPDEPDVRWCSNCGRRIAGHSSVAPQYYDTDQYCGFTCAGVEAPWEQAQRLEREQTQQLQREFDDAELARALKASVADTTMPSPPPLLARTSGPMEIDGATPPPPPPALQPDPVQQDADRETEAIRRALLAYVHSDRGDDVIPPPPLPPNRPVCARPGCTRSVMVSASSITLHHQHGFCCSDCYTAGDEPVAGVSVEDLWCGSVPFRDFLEVLDEAGPYDLFAIQNLDHAPNPATWSTHAGVYMWTLRLPWEFLPQLVALIARERRVVAGAEPTPQTVQRMHTLMAVLEMLENIDTRAMDDPPPYLYLLYVGCTKNTGSERYHTPNDAATCFHVLLQLAREYPEALVFTRGFLAGRVGGLDEEQVHSLEAQIGELMGLPGGVTHEAVYYFRRDRVIINRMPLGDVSSMGWMPFADRILPHDRGDEDEADEPVIHRRIGNGWCEERNVQRVIRFIQRTNRKLTLGVVVKSLQTSLTEYLRSKHGYTGKEVTTKALANFARNYIYRDKKITQAEVVLKIKPPAHKTLQDVRNENRRAIVLKLLMLGWNRRLQAGKQNENSKKRRLLTTWRRGKFQRFLQRIHMRDVSEETWKIGRSGGTSVPVHAMGENHTKKTPGVRAWIVARYTEWWNSLSPERRRKKQRQGWALPSQL